MALEQSQEELLAEIADLRARLEEAESTLYAIRGGEVDAFVVDGPGGEMIYTLGLSELLLQLGVIAEALPILIAYVDRDLRIRFTNHQYEAWFGSPAHELQGRHLREVFGEPAYEVLRQQAEAALDGARSSFETWITCEPVGSRCIQASYVPHVHHGEVQGFVFIVDDITERRRAEEALRESEERFRLVAQATNDVIWEWNLETHAVLWNEAAEVVFGLPPGGHQPDRGEWLDRIHPDDRERVSLRLLDALEGRAAKFEEEYRFQHSDGSWVVLYDRGFSCRNDRGVAVRMVGSILDVTQRKKTEADLRRAKEAAEEANQAKDQFLATLSHELRTPLTPVLAVASLWESDERLPEDVRQGLAATRRNIELEARLIDDLLDLTRVARGKLELQARTADLREVIDLALQTCDAREIADKGLRIDIDAESLGYRLWVDPGRLTQVFWNLLSNAIKFTQPGGSIAVRAQKRDGDLAVTITDDGMGIEMELLEHIFEAFDQGRPETTRRFGGLGLGLAISRAIVELHGGRLNAQSEGAGKGSTFTVTLPLRKGERIEPGARPQSLEKEKQVEPVEPSPCLRILLVEDHPDTAEAMGLLLGRSGHRVTVATTVREALERAEEAFGDSAHGFELVISDVGLPDASGLDLMRELSRRYGLQGLALSGYGMEEDVKRSRAAGFAHHLTKPVTPEVLERTVRNLAEARLAQGPG